MKLFGILKSIALFKIPKFFISIAKWMGIMLFILLTFLIGMGFGINNAKKEDYDPAAPLFKISDSTFFVKMDCSTYTIKGKVIANHCTSNTSNLANAKMFCDDQILTSSN